MKQEKITLNNNIYFLLDIAIIIINLSTFGALFGVDSSENSQKPLFPLNI